jgi:glycosyltransferase involved in cell wall biosynthesis
MFDNTARPPVAEKPISVVLTAADAEAEIEPVVRDWLAYLNGLNRDYEILIIDDQSSDRTLEVARALARDEPRVQALGNTGPRGVGAALRVGLAAAQHPLFFFGDCSGCYQASDLGSFLAVIDQADLVTGYRVGQDSRYRFRTSDIPFKVAVRLLFGVRVKDVECSFKLFRREIFARIPIQSDGIFAHTEILAKANFLGCMMTEAPVNYRGNSSLQLPQSASRQRRREASQIFFRPDFGPAVLPESVAGSTELGEAAVDAEAPVIAAEPSTLPGDLLAPAQEEIPPSAEN